VSLKKNWNQGTLGFLVQSPVESPFGNDSKILLLASPSRHVSYCERVLMIWSQYILTFGASGREQVWYLCITGPNRTTGCSGGESDTKEKQEPVSKKGRMVMRHVKQQLSTTWRKRKGKAMFSKMLSLCTVSLSRNLNVSLLMVTYALKGCLIVPAVMQKEQESG
jgi:hypothetical protein